jgi:hypothetical protein
MPKTNSKNLQDDELYVGPPSAVAQPDPFIGKTIGNCQIIQKINEGGTAFIYKAHNIPFDLDRVVKILKPSLMDEEDFFVRFRQEAQLTARLDHPNILRVFDTGEVGGYFYMEMEYFPGWEERAASRTSSASAYSRESVFS